MYAKLVGAIGVRVTSVWLRPNSAKKLSCKERSTSIAPAEWRLNIAMSGSLGARAAARLSARAYSRR